MSILPLLRYPDPRLRQKCLPVQEFDDGLLQLAGDLADTMRAAPGIGITAAHVGTLLRVAVIELDGPASSRVYINSEVISASVQTARHVEGSVSMPGVTDEIERPRSIAVKFQDLSGAIHEEKADGLLAVCLQHEIDQLDGIFWIDRLSRLKRERIVRKFQKLAGR